MVLASCPIISSCGDAPTSPPFSTVPKVLAHEGRTVNGLRLEIIAKFVPENAAKGSPSLETTFTFLNETDLWILLDNYSLYFRLVPSRVEPIDALEITYHQPKPWCPYGVELDSIIQIPPRKKHVVVRSHWFSSLIIPYGASQKGKVVDAERHQNFKLVKPGQLALAFMYRSDGANSSHLDLAKWHKKEEQLWSGRVYSNPVTVMVRHLHGKKIAGEPNSAQPQ